MNSVAHNISDIFFSETAFEAFEFQKAVNEHAIIAVTDIRGTITSVNDKFVEISGYSREELVGQNHRILNSGRHKPEFFNQLWSTILKGNIWKGEIQNKTKNGSYYWVESTICPIVNSSGQITKFISFRTDVSDRKRSEQELLNKQKNEAIGRLSNNIAHNFNNLLGVIIGTFEILGKNLDEEDKRFNWIINGLSASKRASNIVEKLSKFSDSEILDYNNYPFHNTVSSYVEELSLSLLESNDVEIDVDKDFFDYNFDKEKLEESILQLARNAKDATDGKGTIKFTTKNLNLTKKETWSTITLDPGNYVMLEVSDSGVGIPPAIENMIFDPFFSTKTLSMESGLGMSVVQKFALNHGGKVGFLSSPNENTKIRIYLPEKQNFENEKILN